jgi:hypothetical protein
MQPVTDIRQLDAERITLLIHCSLQAYQAFSAEPGSDCERAQVTAPHGFELLDCWSGVDTLFGRDKKRETYGLVFRSESPPWHYIFAFRGTGSLFDIIDDLRTELEAFIPFDESLELPKIRVEAGFYGIYRTAYTPVASMQQQVFALIDRYQVSSKPIEELSITGHSLGAALSQLFS